MDGFLVCNDIQGNQKAILLINHYDKKDDLSKLIELCQERYIHIMNTNKHSKF